MYKETGTEARGRERLAPSGSFSTARFSAGERFDAWRRLIAETHEIDADAKDFFGEISFTVFDRMVVQQMSADAQSVRRSRRRCRRDGLDHMVVHLATAPFEVETETDSFRVPAGAITINALAQPFRRSRAAERGSLILSLSRDLLTPHLGDPEAFHGAVLQGPHAEILRAHVAALFAQKDRLEAADAPVWARATAQLLAATLAPTRETLGAAGPVAQGATLVRCKAYVERHLRSPDLTPESICKAVGVSRAVLYRLFKPSGGAAAYIRARRLQAVRDALARSHERTGIADLAYSYGFVNVPAFNRAFRAAFGMAPGEVTTTRDIGAEAAPPLYRDWQRRFG